MTFSLKIMTGDWLCMLVNTSFDFECKLSHLSKGQISISNGITLSCGQLHKCKSKILLGKLNLRQSARARGHEATFKPNIYWVSGQTAGSL